MKNALAASLLGTERDVKFLRHNHKISGQNNLDIMFRVDEEETLFESTVSELRSRGFREILGVIKSNIRENEISFEEDPERHS